MTRPIVKLSNHYTSTFNLSRTIATLSALLTFCLAIGLPARAGDDNWEERLKFGQVSPSLYRGKEPGEQDYQYLASRGIKTIVNLRLSPRSARKSAQRAAAHGMKSIHMPIGFFIRPTAEVDKFLNLVNDPDYQPLYIFCQGSRDRVGLLVHAYRIKVQGWPYETAYQELRDHKFRRWLITLWNTAKDMKEEQALAQKNLPARVVRRDAELPHYR